MKTPFEIMQDEVIELKKELKIWNRIWKLCKIDFTQKEIDDVIEREKGKG